MSAPTGLQLEKAAFMSGWLTRHARPDVQPEEAWIEYLDCRVRSTPDRSGEADETRSGSAEGESELPEGSSK